MDYHQMEELGSFKGGNEYIFTEDDEYYIIDDDYELVIDSSCQDLIDPLSVNKTGGNNSEDANAPIIPIMDLIDPLEVKATSEDLNDPLVEELIDESINGKPVEELNIADDLEDPFDIDDSDNVFLSPLIDIVMY